MRGMREAGLVTRMAAALMAVTLVAVTLVAHLVDWSRRVPPRLDGRACVACHGPDGLGGVTAVWRPSDGTWHLVPARNNA